MNHRLCFYDVFTFYPLNIFHSHCVDFCCVVLSVCKARRVFFEFHLDQSANGSIASWYLLGQLLVFNCENKITSLVKAKCGVNSFCSISNIGISACCNNLVSNNVVDFSWFLFWSRTSNVSFDYNCVFRGGLHAIKRWMCGQNMFSEVCCWDCIALRSLLVGQA